MGILTYTREYNVLTLAIPRKTPKGLAATYKIKPASFFYQFNNDDVKFVSFTEYFPFTRFKIEIQWFTEELIYEETFVYTWPLDGHILLSGQDKYLPLLYNPEVTNLKWNYIDTVTPTLGGAYPVVTRNGNQKYRTFTLGGMISYELDEPQSNLFSGYQFLSIDEINSYRSYSQSADEQDLLIERVFRDAVAAWLQNGQKKVFQSEQEGTMIVYLSNFSWTSNKTLGRHNYSFSCTATEIEEATSANIGAVLK